MDQRFISKPVPANTDPIFDFWSTFEIPTFLDSLNLLTMSTPLVVVIQKQRIDERAIVISTEKVDWRELLANNSIEITKEMQPVDLKHKGSLGIIYIQLDIHPYLNKDQLLQTSVVKKQQDLENKFESESYQQFLDYAKEWYSEYKSIRASHTKRLVKIFAQTDDRSSIYTPTWSLIYPLVASKMIDSPFHAARFVSLIPFQRIEDFDSERVEIWHSIQAFMSRGWGDVEDHWVLLWNLLLGFGLETYICVGTNMEGAHTWVMTIDNKGGISSVTFWESLTGQKFKLGNPKINRFYRSIGWVFNDKLFFANIQPDDQVKNTIFDLEDATLWKSMDTVLIKALPRVPVASLMPPEIDSIEEEKALEKALKIKINGLRFSECGLKWKWDNQLEYMLSTALFNYEMERLASLTFASKEFESSIKHYVPEGHTFKAFPIQFNHFDINKMILSLFKNKVAYEIITAKGDSINHAARVKIVPYPEKVCAVWVIIAVRYQSVGE